MFGTMPFSTQNGLNSWQQEVALHFSYQTADLQLQPNKRSYSALTTP